MKVRFHQKQDQLSGKTKKEETDCFLSSVIFFLADTDFYLSLWFIVIFFFFNTSVCTERWAEFIYWTNQVAGTDRGYWISLSKILFTKFAEIVA